jgi:mono/diheme cytochrome c family protein
VRGPASARPILLAAGVATALAVSGCGTKGVDVPESEGTAHTGAELFAQRCSGCHTLSAAGTQGSGTRAVRAQGPNLDQRSESFDDALFAIRNGGFSGSIMPQNIVVGDDAQAVAQFVSQYAGGGVKGSTAPGSSGAAAGGD